MQLSDNPIFCLAAPEDFLADRARQFSELGCSDGWIAEQISEMAPRVIQVRSAFEANALMKGGRA